MNPSMIRRRNSQGYLSGSILVLAALVAMGALATGTMHASADNFTDIFYTNSFRGAFQWFKYLDWVGTLVQIVISAFSLFGVALMTIRIMTSLLFLSAKGMWEEVHDLKSQGGSEEKDLFGLLGMGKSWVQGKAGTGLDAIVGAVLLLLPDVKRYSDFGEKAGGDFSEDMTVTQYILKIAVPTVMTVFFFAMGFNGTLFHALAVTVDFMGEFADRAISVNYTGLVDDMINRNTGYRFTYDLDGTNMGKFKQGLAKDIFGRVVSKVKGIDDVTMEKAGKYIEASIVNGITAEELAGLPNVTEKVSQGLQANPEAYIQYIGYNVAINTSSTSLTGELIDPIDLLTILGGVSSTGSTGATGSAGTTGDSGVVKVGDDTYYLHIVFKGNGDYNGAFSTLQ